MKASPLSGYVLPSAALLWSAALLLAPLAGGSHGHASEASESSDQHVMIVTTDSGAYCRTLSKTIDAHGVLPREIKELKAQGDGLCDEGRVRGGIVRLRRALLMLHEDPDASAPTPH